jgi:putative transposase
MRNILEKVKKRDYDAIEADAQAIYQADRAPLPGMPYNAFGNGGFRITRLWCGSSNATCQELLAFLSFPKPLWRRLRTTNLIERVFVEVRRRTQPMVCFVNVASVDRTIYSIFQRFNLEWRNHTLRVFTQAA